MAVDEWNCSQCTYHHKYPAQRCMMCNALRVSKQQMRDFVSGSGSRGGGAGGGSTSQVASGGGANHSTMATQGECSTMTSSARNHPQHYHHPPSSTRASSSNQDSLLARGTSASASASAMPTFNSRPNSSGGSSIVSSRPSSVANNPYSNRYSKQQQHHPSTPSINNPYSKQSSSSRIGNNNNGPNHSNISSAQNNNAATSQRAMPMNQQQRAGKNNNNNNNFAPPKSPYNPRTTAAPNNNNNTRLPRSNIRNPYANNNNANANQNIQHRPPSRPVTARGVGGSAAMTPIHRQHQHHPQQPPASHGAFNNNDREASWDMRSRPSSMPDTNQSNQHQQRQHQLGVNYTQQWHQQQQQSSYHQQQQQWQQGSANMHQSPVAVASSGDKRPATTVADPASSSPCRGNSSNTNKSLSNAGVRRQGTLTSSFIGYKEGPVPMCQSTSETWIYPLDENYPERVYQVQMSHSAIMQNTLVSLPTGLGKTLIAAVVMYNYYRWFPTGKVVFCAPTRPLVSQQIHACYKIMGIPEKHTAEISGRSKPTSRDSMWANKRVFFCTPQTLVRDIEEKRCNPQSIVCVVMDEAHRATGDHANAILVRLITEARAKFRLVGLSATPGSDIKAIQAVLETLNISKIEARTEDDPNVKQYIHHREEEVIIVKQPDVVKSLDRQFADLIAPILAQLREDDVVRQVAARLFFDSASLKPWSVITAQRDYQERVGSRYDSKFNILRELCGARQALKEHGVQMARTKLAEATNKRHMGYMAKTPAFQALLRDITVAANGGVGGEEDGPSTFDSFENNPKLIKLAEVLREHFERKQAINESTRVIVFSQWRESVRGIVQMLSMQNTSLVKPAQFIGQAGSKKSSGGGSGKSKRGSSSSNNTGQDAAGMNQAQQQRVLQQFSEGVYNVLVCTCVGEEGLDIGEVDLIVNFDVMKSAVRSIQRNGRTGRKRNGRVIFLVAEGQEEKSYKQSVSNTKKIFRSLKNQQVFKLSHNTPMFPAEPSMMRRKMNVTSFHLSQVGGHTPKVRRQNGGPKKRQKRQNKRTSRVVESNWRLDPAQEQERVSLFGNLPILSCQEYEGRSCEFPSSLKRKYLRSRNQSIYGKMLLKGKVPPMIMSAGKSSTIVKKLEKSHCSIVSDATQAYPSVNASTSNIGAIMQRAAESIDSDNDCGHVDFDCDSVEELEKYPDDMETSNISPNCPADPLDGIFGLNHKEKCLVSSSIDPVQLANLFDSVLHKNCAVVAPPGMALADSEEDSESAVSSSSDISIDDDLCAFFDKDNSRENVLRSEPQKSYNGETMKTPYSDHDSDVDFGADDHLDFGNISQIEKINSDSEADVTSFDPDADDTRRCIESETATDGGKHTSAQTSSSKQIVDEERSDSACNKENINTQFSLSPVCEDIQSNSMTGGKTLEHAHTKRTEKVQSGPHEDILVEDARHKAGGDHLKTSGLNSDISVECSDHNIQAQEDFRSPVVAFRLPTPPPSSSDSDDDDDCSNEESESQNVPLVQPKHDPSFESCPPESFPGNLSNTDEFQSENLGDFIVENNETAEGPSSHVEVSFFQLPTQDSSSSSSEEEEEDGEGDVSEGNDAGPGFPVEPVDGTLLSQKPGGEAFRERATTANGNKQGNLNEKSPTTQLSGTPESRHVQFKISSLNKTSGADDLTDTPVQARFSLNSSRKVGANSRMSLDSLTDTPVPCRKNIEPQRKSLDSLTDTPLQPRLNMGQQRKRLRTMPKHDSSKKSAKRTAEKLQRKDTLKQRIEDKYRCRFLDGEAANDDSDESDEEDALRQLEDEEMSHDSFINDTSQLGYTQDDLDGVDVDEEIEVCDHGESIIHRQFNHQHNVDNQFKTPVFNRKMRTPASDSQHSELSQKGLGNMNFIRSVLEHHRQGGDADQLEEEYHRLARDSRQSQEGNTSEFDSPTIQLNQPKNPYPCMPSQPSTGAGTKNASSGNWGHGGTKSHQNTTTNRTIRDVPASSSTVPSNHNQPVQLTAEQRAMIEAKRAEALKKRQQRMQQKSAPLNPYVK